MATANDQLLQNKTVRQFVKFAIVGASSTLIDWGVHYLLYKGMNGALAEPVRQWWLKVFPSIASHPAFDGAFTTFKAISFIVATVNGFFWNRAWTFRITDSENRAQHFWRFMLVTGTGLVINTLVASRIHTKGGGMWNYVFALGVATFITMFWNFTGHKLWTFKSEPKPTDA